MKSFCMYRDSIYSPVFQSLYDFTSGTIDGVPEYKFKCILPEYYSTEYDTPVNFGTRFDKSLYMLALYFTKGLVAFNFYDVGITVLSNDGVWLFFNNNHSVKYMEGTNNLVSNVFSYTKHFVGTYKTVVNQLDIPMGYSLLVVDDKGDAVIDNEVINITEYSECSIEELMKLNCIKVWRDKYDGLVYCGNGKFNKYKIIGNNIEIIKEM